MIIQIKYSTEWNDITHLVKKESFKRTQKLHNDLKPTINVLKMNVIKDVSLMNAITNSNDVYVRVYEDDGTTFYFYGKALSLTDLIKCKGEEPLNEGTLQEVSDDLFNHIQFANREFNKLIKDLDL
jgi:hypothetical protein